jgi:hypothetical protein
MIALAVPESVDVDYANIQMRFLPYGEDIWKAFDWQARESLISKGVVALVRSILEQGTGLALNEKTAAVFDVSGDLLDVVNKHCEPVRNIFADLNHYDIVQIQWDWSVFRWDITSYRHTGQAKVEILIPVQFGATFTGDQRVALLATYRNHPRNVRGLTHTQENFHSWTDFLTDRTVGEPRLDVNELGVVPASPTIGAEICKRGYGWPQCSAVPFDTSQNIASPDNGFAKAAVARNVISGYRGIHRPEFANDGFYKGGRSCRTCLTG